MLTKLLYDAVKFVTIIVDVIDVPEALYRIHNYSTLVCRADTTARRIKFCVRSSHLHRLSLSGRRFYKAPRCFESPFVRGARPKGQSNGSYRVRVQHHREP